jgi:hypothetical protein
MIVLRSLVVKVAEEDSNADVVHSSSMAKRGRK